MMTIIKFIKDFRSQSEFEIVLKRVLESKKLSFVKELKALVILEGFNGQIQNMKPEESFSILYNQFRHCRNDVAAIKILIIIHKLLLKSKTLRDNIDMDQLLQYYRKPAKCNQVIQQIYQNLIAHYCQYIKSVAERVEYYQECFQPANEIVERNLSSNSKFDEKIKISKNQQQYQFLPFLEYLLSKKTNKLLDTLTLQILNDAQVYYDQVNYFIVTNQYRILEQGKDSTTNFLIYQLYVDLIQATTWIKKLFLLSNLTDQRQHVTEPKLYVVDCARNKEYELYIQMIRNKYEIPSPDSSPKFQNLYYAEEEKKFAIILKPSQLYTGLAQSERPLEYNEFNEQNIEM